MLRRVLPVFKTQARQMSSTKIFGAIRIIGGTQQERNQVAAQIFDDEPLGMHHQFSNGKEEVVLIHNTDPKSLTLEQGVKLASNVKLNWQPGQWRPNMFGVIDLQNKDPSTDLKHPSIRLSKK